VTFARPSIVRPARSAERPLSSSQSTSSATKPGRPPEILRDPLGRVGRLRFALEVLLDLGGLHFWSDIRTRVVLRALEEVEERHRGVPGLRRVVDGLGREQDQHLRVLGLGDQRFEHREDREALAQVRVLDLEHDRELARDAARDLDDREQRALPRDAYLELLLAGLGSARLRGVDEVLEPLLHALGLVRDLRVERHLHLAAERRRAMEPREERAEPTEERVPAVFLVRVCDAPDEHVVRLATARRASSPTAARLPAPSGPSRRTTGRLPATAAS
jgi:hypothetical protein